MLIIKNKFGLFVYGEIKDNYIVPLIHENKEIKIYMIKVKVKDNKIYKIIVDKEITEKDNKVLFQSILNMRNLI